MSYQPPPGWSPDQPGQQQQYPSQSPYAPMQPPAAPTKKKSKTWLWIIAIIVAFFVGTGVGGAGKTSTPAGTTPTTSNQSTSDATPVPTKATAPKTWQTTHSYTGNGAKKTEKFTVGSEWKIQWSCQGNTQYGVDGLLYITVYKDGSSLPIDSPSTTCKATSAKTTGESEEHQGGTVYLDINTGIEWTITIQELK